MDFFDTVGGSMLITTKPETLWGEKTKNVVNQSGGKDSLATALVARELEVPNVEFVFADTGHEHEITYDYISYLETKLGAITRVKADFSDRIKNKAIYVQEKWPAKLAKETPGRWKRFRGSKLPKEQEFEATPAPIEDERRFEIGIQQGDFVWLSARRPMTDEQIEITISRALSVLRPTGNPFLDLCVWKGRFPSTKARFCTTELKHDPVKRQVIEPAYKAFDQVVSWQGVRAQESAARVNLEEFETLLEDKMELDIDRPIAEIGLHTYRPVHKWRHEDVFAIAKRHGIKPNPLYEKGCSRVGCMPCVNVNKGELREIFLRFPEVVERLHQWELLTAMASKRGNSTFFPSSFDPVNRAYDSQLVSVQTHGIKTMREYAMTARGGRHYDLFSQEGFQDMGQCSSVYAGVCE